MVEERFLTRRFTAVLRGVCILLIVWAHTANEFPRQLEQWHMTSLLLVGTYATGLFFFLSGYGLTLSMSRKEVDGSYLLSHLWRLMAPYLVFWVCYVIIGAGCRALEPGHDGSMLTAFLTLSMPQADGWFFKTITAIYIIYIGLSLWNRRLAAAVVAAGLMIYVVVMARSGAAGYWWNTVLCFPLGICYAHGRRMRTLTAPAAAVALLLFAVLYKTPALAEVASVGCPILVCVALAALSTRIDIARDIPILSFIGANSIYMYLMEAIPIDFIDSQRVGFIPFVVIAMAVTTVLTWVGRRVEMMVMQGVKH